MRKLIILAALVASPAFSQGSTTVRGHVRSDGVYVPPHTRTNPNDTKLDNWSTQGNWNPNTGRSGSVDPYKPSSSNPFGSPSNKPRRSSSGW